MNRDDAFVHLARFALAGDRRNTVALIRQVAARLRRRGESEDSEELLALLTPEERRGNILRGEG